MDDKVKAELEAIAFNKLGSAHIRQRGGNKSEEIAAMNDIVVELAEECLRWRKSHDRGKDGFNPDYCAARDALKEHLEYCQPAAERAERLAGALRAIAVPAIGGKYQQNVAKEALKEWEKV